MEFNQFLTNFINQFDETPLISIDKNTKFREELEGWDSLVALGVMSMISDEYNISITGDEMKRCVTINDIFELIKSKS
jgi:acyl carrier protein